MSRICIVINGICKLEVLTHGSKAYAAFIRPLTAECPEENGEFVEALRRFIQGEIGPEDILDHIEFGKGVKRLVQIATLAIPRGKVACYSQIARLTGLHSRTVGVFLALNELPIIIPCHRVVRKDGYLGGYTAGIELKKALLKSEGVAFKGDKVAKESFIDDLELSLRYNSLIQRVLKKAQTR